MQPALQGLSRPRRDGGPLTHVLLLFPLQGYSPIILVMCGLVSGVIALLTEGRGLTHLIHPVPAAPSKGCVPNKYILSVWLLALL